MIRHSFAAFKIKECKSSNAYVSTKNVAANKNVKAEKFKQNESETSLHFLQQQDQDKSFLIQFSNDVASARTKDELSRAIHLSLKKLAQIKAYFIRIINLKQSSGSNRRIFFWRLDMFIHYFF